MKVFIFIALALVGASGANAASSNTMVLNSCRDVNGNAIGEIIVTNRHANISGGQYVLNDLWPDANDDSRWLFDFYPAQGPEVLYVTCSKQIK